MIRYIRKIVSHDWLGLLYVNFRYLPFRQAIKLPIDIHRNGLRFKCRGGKILIKSEDVYSGMIRFSAQGDEMFEHLPAIVDIRDKSVLIFKGKAEIGVGALVRVEQGGVLTFGKKCRVGAKSKIFCTNRITFGNEVGISWESQVFDTNFHYMQNMQSGEVYSPKGAVFIGNRCWISNRVCVMKGSYIPDNTIVASNSLVNKNFQDLPPNSMLAGCPAKLVKHNVRRLFEGVDKIDKCE